MRNPKAENLVRFKIEGPGTIVGVGNANPVSTESYQQPQRKAWKGRCLVIVKSGKKDGNVNLKVTADGLTSASVQINIR
jgi:beta-galactosidase